eukprot:957948-Pelagomonas_calceolata.AAC.4
MKCAYITLRQLVLFNLTLPGLPDNIISLGQRVHLAPLQALYLQDQDVNIQCFFSKDVQLVRGIRIDGIRGTKGEECGEGGYAKRASKEQSNASWPSRGHIVSA